MRIQLALPLALLACSPPPDIIPVPASECQSDYLARQSSQPEQFPIHVQLSIEMPNRYRAAVREAVQQWNRDFDADLFFATDALPPDRTNDHECAVAWVDWGGTDGVRLGTTGWDRCRASVELLNRGTQDLLHVSKHELGHVLNLRHSGELNSLMGPRLLAQSTEQLDLHQKCLVQTALIRGGMTDPEALTH